MHVSQLGARFGRTREPPLQPGDRVEVRVLKVDLEKKQISLSMKPAAERAPGAAARSGRAERDTSPQPERGPREGRSTPSARGEAVGEPRVRAAGAAAPSGPDRRAARAAGPPSRRGRPAAIGPARRGRPRPPAARAPPGRPAARVAPAGLQQPLRRPGRPQGPAERERAEDARASPRGVAAVGPWQG